MRQRRARAMDQIVFAVVVWSSCFPVVSALCDMEDSCGLSKSTIIGILAAGAALIIFLLICGVCIRRRRLQKRVVRLSHVPYDGMGGRLSNPPKPYNAPVYGGYHSYHQAPRPVHIPQYPPRGYDAYHSQSRSQPTSYTIPGPTTPVSPGSMRAPSSTISSPISSLDTTSLALRSSVRRNEPTMVMPPPSSSLSPVSLRSTRTNVAESPLPSVPSSPLHRSPSVTISPAPAPSPRPSGAMPPINTAPPSTPAPMHTGTSNNMEEPPPAYTPV